MRFSNICLLFRALFISAAALLPCAAFSQSLSIVKDAENGYRLEASAPANDPYTLQASENLHLWVDIQENIQEPYSVPIENSVGPRRYFRLIQSTSPAPPIRVLIIGDSMASECCGWGRGITPYFKPNVTLVNYAMPWTSTKVFLQSAELDKMLLIKPDYVLIQYGFIDGGTDADRWTTLEEFAENLRTIVGMVRGFNGTPILITLHAARLWDDKGELIPAWEDRNDVTRALAAELKTPLIDLYKSTRVLFAELGPEGTEFMRWEGGSPDDFMHFSLLGGQYVSRLVCNEFPDALGPYLTGILEQPPKP